MYHPCCAQAGYSGKRFVFDKAHALGVKAVVLDGPDRWDMGMAAWIISAYWCTFGAAEGAAECLTWGLHDLMGICSVMMQLGEADGGGRHH